MRKVLPICEAFNRPVAITSRSWLRSTAPIAQRSGSSGHYRNIHVNTIRLRVFGSLGVWGARVRISPSRPTSCRASFGSSSRVRLFAKRYGHMSQVPWAADRTSSMPAWTGSTPCRGDLDAGRRRDCGRAPVLRDRRTSRGRAGLGGSGAWRRARQCRARRSRPKVVMTPSPV
jgi:hypothetical protein